MSTAVKTPRRPLKKHRASALYGLEHTIGCVSIGVPSDKESRRKAIRARVYADNHS